MMSASEGPDSFDDDGAQKATEKEDAADDVTLEIGQVDDDDGSTEVDPIFATKTALNDLPCYLPFTSAG